MILLLAKMLGVRRLTGWGVRLAQVAVLLLLVGAAVVALLFSKDAQNIAMALAALGLCVAVFRLLWARRRGKAETGPRTIDGKVVPEMLAAAALGVPVQSPDGDSVLRGLPDYGKVLLKLGGAEFEYLPEVVPDKLPELPEPEPEEIRPWFAGVPRWVMVASAAGLLVVAGVGIRQGRGHSSASSQSMPLPVAAAEAPQESAPAPLRSPVVVAKAGEQSIAPVHAPEPVDRVITADGELAEAAPAPASTPAPIPEEPKPATTPTAAAPRYITNPADGLLWTRDNGFDISWGDAIIDCNKFFARVPTQAQRETLVDTRLLSNGKYYWTITQSEGSWPDGKPRYNSYSQSAGKWVTLFSEGKTGDRVLCVKALSQ